MPKVNTCFSLKELWDEGFKDIFIYELTPKLKVIKRKVVDITEFNNYILILISFDGTNGTILLPYNNKHKVKREQGDSKYYTDARLVFEYVKENYSNSDKLHQEIFDKTEKAEALLKEISSIKEKLSRVKSITEGSLESLNECVDISKEISDKYSELVLRKDSNTLAKSRINNDFEFSFICNRIAKHSNRNILDVAEEYQNLTSLELNDILMRIIKSQEKV